MKNYLLFVALLLMGSGCIHTQSEVDVKPIHIIIDVNVRVQVDKELDDMFADLDESQDELEQGAE